MPRATTGQRGNGSELSADATGPRLSALVAGIGDGELRQLESLIRAELRRRKQALAERSGTADLETQLRGSLVLIGACDE